MRKIRYKIELPLVVGLVIAVMIFSTYSVHNSSQMANAADIEHNRITLYEQFDQRIKREVENCISVIEHFYEKQQSGEMTEAEAKKAAADRVRELRFGDSNYFWVDTVEGVNVVLLGSDTEGTSRYSAQDSQGVYYVQEFIKNGLKEGGGYTDYKFPRPNQTDPMPKRAYTLLYKPYNWVIGTGNYVDDMDKVVKGYPLSLLFDLYKVYF